MHLLFVGVGGCTQTVDLPGEQLLEVGGLRHILECREGVPAAMLRLVLNGKELHDGQTLAGADLSSAPVRVLLRLEGGKGGFGAMLRAQGMSQGGKKTTNFDACRDLQGRRIRHVNDAKRLVDWREKQADGTVAPPQTAAQMFTNIKHAGKRDFRRGNNAHLVKDHAEERIQERVGGKGKAPERHNADLTTDEIDRMLPAMSEDDAMSALQQGLKAKAARVDGAGESAEGGSSAAATKRGREEEEAPPLSAGDEGPSKKKAAVAPTGATAPAAFPIPAPAAVPAAQASKPAAVGPVKPPAIVFSEADKEDINLSSYSDVESLAEAVSADRLKFHCMRLGLKCGGTALERAGRFYLTKDTPLDQLPPHVFAGKGKGKKK